MNFSRLSSSTYTKSNPGPAAGTKLDATKVFNDAYAKDALTGGSEDDWFLTSVGNILKDRLTAETVTSII